MHLFKLASVFWLMIGDDLLRKTAWDLAERYFEAVTSRGPEAEVRLQTVRMEYLSHASGRSYSPAFRDIWYELIASRAA